MRKAQLVDCVWACWKAQICFVLFVVLRLNERVNRLVKLKTNEISHWFGDLFWFRHSLCKHSTLCKAAWFLYEGYGGCCFYTLGVHLSSNCCWYLWLRRKRGSDKTRNRLKLRSSRKPRWWKHNCLQQKLYVCNLFSLFYGFRSIS